MILNDFITRLEGARQTRSGCFSARCPAHDDRSPSLLIREAEDGRLLLKCFAGCSADDVVSAIGLTLADLFPTTQIEHARPIRRPFLAADVLRAISFECDLIVIYAGKMTKDGRLTDYDRERLLLAATRVNNGVSEALQ